MEDETFLGIGRNTTETTEMGVREGQRRKLKQQTSCCGRQEGSWGVKGNEEKSRRKALKRGWQEANS